MVSKTVKASTLTGTGVATLMFLIMLFSQAGDDPVGYCESTGEFCIAREGFSGGENTRCYNESGMNWWEAPYCSEGWQKVKNDLNISDTNESSKTSFKGDVKCREQGCKKIE